MVTLLIHSSPVTSITKNDIDPSTVPITKTNIYSFPVPVLASVDAANTNSNLIQTWSMKFLLKQLLDSTTFAEHTNNYLTHHTSTA